MALLLAVGQGRCKGRSVAATASLLAQVLEHCVGLALALWLATLLLHIVFLAQLRGLTRMWD